MRFVLMGAALIALLHPFFCLAQCEDQEWVATTSVLAPGAFTNAPFSPMVLFSVHDQSLIAIHRIVSPAQSSNTVNINGEPVQVASCSPGSALIIQKIDSEGQIVWWRHMCFTMDGVVNGMALDNDGGLYFGGFFKGDLQFEGDPISQSTNISTHYTAKIGVDGDLLWHTTGIRANSSGHIWTDDGLLVFVEIVDSTTFAGQTIYHQNPTTPPSTEIAILMVDSGGQIIWSRHIEGNGTKSARLVSGRNGKCLIQGIFNETISYDGQALTNTGQTSLLYQLAIDTESGSRLWMKKQLNDGTAILTYGSEFIDDGTVITAGHYNGSPSVFAFEGQTISSSNGLTDGYIMRQDANTGELLWLKTLAAAGYSSITGMTKTSTGVALTGFFSSPELNYEGLTLVNHNDETDDPFIIVVDKDGKPQCQIDAIGTEAYDRGWKILQDSNHLYTLIEFSDSTAFGDFALEAQGSMDIALWKTCLPCDTLTSIAEATGAQPTLQVYPNPASTQTQLSYRSPQGTSPTLQLRDMLDRSVQTVQLAGHEGTYTLNAAGLGTGFYFCSLLNGTEVLATEKLSVIRNE